jgi:pimeloyl-ACP methyl ester carboxylesterase
MNLRKFILAGHSFGGYFSILYALRYPEVVQKLLLFSPVGIPEKNPDVNIKNFIKKLSLPKRMFFNYILGYWKEEKSPFSILRGIGRGSKLLLKGYMKMFKGISGKV